MDWSIQQLARLAGTTSRTLRHYDDIGLLAPSRVAANGYRHYDEEGLVRLQRILLLRQLGLGLSQISDVLDRDVSESVALRTHLQMLQGEAERLQRQIAAVRRTIRAREEGTSIMAEDALDGFDIAQHRDEVARRWGRDAAEQSAQWWQAKSQQDQAAWQRAAADLGQAWTEASEAGLDPFGAEGQALAARHVAWLCSIPGTPAASGTDVAGYVRGLAALYVADDRFAANYGGPVGAAFVRDALLRHAETLG